MDRMIYLAMSGAKATMQRQEVLSHNLANLQTPGFKADLTAFRAVPVLGDAATTRAYAIETTPGYDPTPGPVQATGRPLDVAPLGRAWLTVQALDGTEAYTRAGAFERSPEGVLVTAQGLPVLGDGGPITLPERAELGVAADGAITAKVGNARPQVVGRLKLVTPEAPLQRGTDGLFRAAEGELPADATARVQGGALESSNVSAVETMVAMIAASRQFEQQMQMLKTAQEREGAAGRLLGASSY